MVLTDTAVRNAIPDNKLKKLRDGTGLYLLVNSSGKYWRYDYRYFGKRKTISYGVYPTVGLAAARKKHLEAKTLLSDGIDPMQSRKVRKQLNENTFRAIASKWYEKWRSDKTDKHATEVWKRLESDVLPVLGDMPIDSIKAIDVRNCIKAIEARGAIDMAKRQLQKCGQVMRFAVANGLVERNPVADIKPSDILPAYKKRNYPRLTLNELPQLLKDIENYVGGQHTKLALKLMSLTFVRTGELIGAIWDEIDLDSLRWNIPAERMKMRTPHVVPLSKQAVTVIQQLEEISYGREYLFPADTGRPTHISNNTILYALYRMGYRGRMTGHGFRGIASTALHEQGWPHEHIELQLAHQERDQVSAAYNYAQYLPQRAKLMQAWADYLDGLMISNVVNIKQA